MRPFCVLLILTLPLTASGQGPAPVTLVARVVDSAKAPVAAADVAVVRGLSMVVAHATTDGAGRATLTLPRADGDHQLIVRKLGFQPAYLFFATTRADSLPLDVRLARTVATLAPVTITATEDLKRKRYRLTADDIENSTRPVIDGTDLFKLRPDMMNSRGGPSACQVLYTPRDGWIESVWVNGRRVTLAAVDSAVAYSRKAGLGIARRPPPRPNLRITPQRRAGPLPSALPTYSHIDTVLSILATMRPEHIAEVTYHDCFDASIEKNNADMAMFIVLKPGVEYRPNIGTFVVDAATAAEPHASLNDLPRYRFRLLGVFDGATGDPLPDVEVVDTKTGDRARTSATGTVSLFFVPEGRSGLLVRGAGYRDTTLDVTISPADTVPLTIVLTARPPMGPR